MTNDLSLEPKKWWTSKTVWATAVTIIIGGYETARMTYPTLPEIPPYLLMILGGFGLYGRVKATRPIS